MAPADAPAITPFPPRRRTLAALARGLMHAAQAAAAGAQVACYRLDNVGLDVCVRRNTLFARHLAKYRSWEPVNSNWVMRSVGGRAGGLYVDVGANFGWYSLLLARCALPGSGATVVAIEPDPDNYALLRQNVARNRLDGIVALCVGVGARRMQATLSAVEAMNPGAHTMRPVPGAAASRTVPVEPLDDLLALYPGPIVLLKMDIEGYEIDALSGARATLARTEQLLIEYSPRYLRACGHAPERLIAQLRAAGFRPHLIGEGGLTATDESRLVQLVGESPDAPRAQIDLVFRRA
jgi:FkbM family methyltransferase